MSENNDFDKKLTENQDKVHKQYIEKYGQKIFDDAMKASDFSVHNKSSLEKSKKCGCYYCLEIFSPAEIEEWTDKEGDTAICPYCHIDSVIGESSELPLTKEFLEKAKLFWFEVTYDFKGDITYNPFDEKIKTEK